MSSQDDFAVNCWRTSHISFEKSTKGINIRKIQHFGQSGYDGGEDYWVAHGLDIVKAKRPEDYKTNVRYPGFWNASEIDEMVRRLQPGIVTNDRIGMRQYGDYTSPEMKIGDFDIDNPWETCETLTGDWAYRPNSKMRSLRSCIHLLIKCVTAGGNLLLNVAPNPDGEIEAEQAKRLKEIGDWLKKYGKSIYKTRGGPIKCTNWGGVTNRDNKILQGLYGV